MQRLINEMGLAFSFGQMEASMRAFGRMIRLGAKEE
jgi:hypothetical protein